jgi:hypothetical protein
LIKLKNMLKLFSKKKEKDFFFGKMRKVIKFYKIFYILGRLLISRRKNNN